MLTLVTSGAHAVSPTSLSRENSHPVSSFLNHVIARFACEEMVQNVAEPVSKTLRALGILDHHCLPDLRCSLHCSSLLSRSCACHTYSDSARRLQTILSVVYRLLLPRLCMIIEKVDDTDVSERVQ